MKMKLPKSILAVGLAALASVQTTTSHAAPYTVIGYDSSAASLRSNLLYNADDAAADACYNALIASSSPAALAGFYTFERNSFSDFYANIGVYLFNYYYYQSYFDFANLAAYAQAASDSRAYYNEIAADYIATYDDSANSGANAITSVVTWGGNIDDAIAQTAYFVENIDDATLAVESSIAAYYAGSYYQYAVIYRSIADGIFNVYNSAALLAYYNYLKAGDAPTGVTVYNETINDGYVTSLVYYAYESYYRNLTIANE